MKKLLLSFALLLGLGASAPAQVNVVPQVGVTFGYIPKVTYSAGYTGLVAAAATTDLVCLAGSATKVVAIQNISVGGTATTAIHVAALLIRRAAVDTGGTPGATTANPANTITKFDTNSAAATAVPISYTANPTITDAAGTILATKNLALSLPAPASVNNPAVFDFTDQSNLISPLYLRGIAQQVCINLGATSPAATLLSGHITWTEE